MTAQEILDQLDLSALQGSADSTGESNLVDVTDESKLAVIQAWLDGKDRRTIRKEVIQEGSEGQQFTLSRSQIACILDAAEVLTVTEE